MAVFFVLLRAINVGGTGKLPMTELRALCEEQGFTDVKTYIQSGNVVLNSTLPKDKVKQKLKAALAKKMGKPVGVLVRTRAELQATLDHNPFPNAKPQQLLVLFLDTPKEGGLGDVVISGSEELELRGRELYIHFPDGMGRSKLKVPFAKEGTGRNLNTVTKLLELASER